MIMPWSKYALMADGKTGAELEALFIEAMSEASLAELDIMAQVVDRLGGNCNCATCWTIRRHRDIRKKGAS